MRGSRRRLRLPLTLHLGIALTFVAVLLAAGVAHVTASRSRDRAELGVAERRESAAVSLARRAAPMLERGDDLRLRVLAVAAADLVGARVELIDAAGVVRVDTGSSAGGDAETHGAISALRRRATADGGEEVVAPALGADGPAGVVRLRFPRAFDDAVLAWPWTLFGVALLALLSLVALACWMAHTWVTRIAGLARRTELLADAGSPDALLSLDATPGEAAVGGLQEALAAVARRFADDRDRGRSGGLRLAREVVHALERRDLVPAGHPERTQRLALTLANEIGAPADVCDAVRDAAPLLDLGKAGVRASALTKSGELDEVERESLRQHPVRGARLIGVLDGLGDVAAAIRHQHEKYDGSGFPLGLRGTRIPLASRILAIAAAFDLLVEGCAAFAGVSWPEALDSLRDDRGEHFDPELLDAFEELVRRSPPVQAVRKDVMISTAGVVPHRQIDESHGDALDPLDLFSDEAEDILAAGGAELELLVEELDDDGEHDP
ncbi:MAG: HD domain-containing protein [Planctomycetes bacterium]|nr:HD domain-containing protein [Planctomycetota bacterium]